MCLMKKSPLQLAVSLVLGLSLLMPLASCHDIEEYDNTVSDNFQALWDLFDQHYCFFNEKNVDWDSIYEAYRPRALSCHSRVELFNTFSDMLAELKDGHVNLASSFDVSYYRQWWSDYPQNFNERVLNEYYLYFNQKTVCGSSYAILLPNVGYIRIPSFDYAIGQGNIDNIFYYMRLCKGLVIDVRDNGGGSMDNVESWVRRFISGKTLVGYIMHKDGPGHDDFSEPYAYYYSPPQGHDCWLDRPVVVLANRSTYSAANNFVSVMKLLPNVTVMGATTGGGSGMPLTYELPVGWTVRMSAAPVLDAQGNTTEFGVEPTPGYAINNTAEQEAAGQDAILDAAIAFIMNPPR